MYSLDLETILFAIIIPGILLFFLLLGFFLIFRYKITRKKIHLILGLTLVILASIVILGIALSTMTILYFIFFVGPPLVLGLIFMSKYIKTREKKFLILGLIFTFIFIGAFIYVFYRIPSTTVMYAPPEEF